MDPPPIQYVTTSDRHEIAYSVVGDGVPFVMVPFPFNNLHLVWASAVNRSLYEALAQRFQLVQYDSRGMGMSSRDLTEGHALNDYLLDLDAVVERLALRRFVLFAGPLLSCIAAQYAVQWPERV